MCDVRLLTLYKQHYMDCYDDKLLSEYSCWGYYDGMDIVKVEPDRYDFPGKGCPSAPISALWYRTGEKSNDITGLYGSINIGLFHSMGAEEKQKTDEFWDKKRRMPFFGVSFLQTEGFLNYKELSKKLDGMSASDEEKECHIVTYYTYDNADLVLIICGNSLSLLEGQLHKIDEMVEIRYQHAILGVSEQYLKECKNEETILKKWSGVNCHIGERVASLDVRIVSSGESGITDIEKNILDDINATYGIKNYEETSCSYVSGHENMVFSFKETQTSHIDFSYAP